MTALRRLAGPACMFLALSALNWACTDLPSSPNLDEPTAEMSKLALPNPQRTALQDGIAHYTFDLPLGAGPFDVVRLHRVVKEQRPNDPARTADAVFLLPGAPNSWPVIFMEPVVSTAIPWDQSIAIFLAENDIDVWGIDYAWAQVPLETTNFDFMEGWGVQKDVDFAYEALAVAQSIRVATGQGNGRFHVLGFSYGVPVGYALAGRETRLPPGQRIVKGLIPVDLELKYEDPARRASACAAAAEQQQMIDSGRYEEGSFVPLLSLAALAETSPTEPSPIPGLNLREFILFVGATGDTHFVGAYFNDAGIPTGLRFTNENLWLRLLQNTPPYWPLQASTDLDYARCETGPDVSFDDHIRDITVPIFNLGAAGGTGLGGNYTATLTASEDLQSFVVQMLPDDQWMYDFGHADLFTATDAATQVWQPILTWIVEHRENRVYP
jgi:hypothetical protein